MLFVEANRLEIAGKTFGEPRRLARNRSERDDVRQLVRHDLSIVVE